LYTEGSKIGRRREKQRVAKCCGSAGGQGYEGRDFIIRRDMLRRDLITG